jgi:DNA end-binding protein Ku
MPATIWKGHLTFGLVSIPVRLVRAARAQKVNLRQLYRPRQPQKLETILADTPPKAAFVSDRAPTGARPQERKGSVEDNAPASIAAEEVVPVKRRYEPSDGREHDEPISNADLVKGYEYAKGEYVVLDEHELRSIVPKTSTELQIVEFVYFNEIDPVYLETSYYVAPDETGEKPYALLFRAMEESGYAAIGQVTMHRRDHVVILRTGRSGLIAHTMFYSDEVRTIDEFRTNTNLVSDKELDLAKALVKALATSFQPDKFKNDFRKRLHQLIESRAADRQVSQVAAPNPPKVIEIMDALKRSLEQAKTLEPVSSPTQKAARKPASTERSSQETQTRRSKQKP